MYAKYAHLCLYGMMSQLWYNIIIQILCPAEVIYSTKLPGASLSGCHFDLQLGAVTSAGQRVTPRLHVASQALECFITPMHMDAQGIK